jgi:hypothetical protein
MHSLDAVLHKVHGGADHMHQGCRLYQYSHAMLLHQLVKFAPVICTCTYSLQTCIERVCAKCIG